jgi:hypothetical protein
MALRLVEANRAIQAVLAKARDLALNISVGGLYAKSRK